MIKADQGIEDVVIYWAHCFDVFYNPKVYDHQMGMYIRELHYTDRHAATMLSIMCAIPIPWDQPVQSFQLTLDIQDEKIRI
tara:strand:- start:307 stop:549 length:243 start_codon:yes stop_codon:yes gene_type:complete